MSVKDKFDQLVNKFALKVDDHEKKQLVKEYNLPPKYYTAGAGECFKGLKMMGVFSPDKPEGLLDIADVLQRPDLKRKFQGELTALNMKKLRESTTKIDLEQLYDSLAFDQSLEIAQKQVTVGMASTELLKQITKFRFKDDDSTRNRVLIHLRAAIAKLEEVTDLIKLAGDEAFGQGMVPGMVPIQERREDLYEDENPYETVVSLTPPVSETTEVTKPSLYDNIGKGAVHTRQQVQVSSPKQERTMPSPIMPRRGTESPVLGRRKGPAPPPNKPKPQKKTDEYDILVLADYTGSGSDSGLGSRDEWPLPKVLDKPHEYQRLRTDTLESHEYSSVPLVSNPDQIRSPPKPPPKPKK